MANPNTSGRLLHDAYAAHHRQHTHNFHASRWDTRMSARMARQLAEEISGDAAGCAGVDVQHKNASVGVFTENLPGSGRA